MFSEVKYMTLWMFYRPLPTCTVYWWQTEDILKCASAKNSKNKIEHMCCDQAEWLGSR